MAKPFLLEEEIEFDFDTGIWWAYFVSEDNGDDRKKLGITKMHYRFQARIDPLNKRECKKYLLKRAQEYMKKYPDFSEMPNKTILGSDDKQLND